MYQKLKELSNALKSQGFFSESKTVESLLKIKRASNEITLDPEKKESEILIPELRTTIDVNSHPLGKKVREYCEKVAALFNTNLATRDASISVKDIDNLVDEFKKYNNDLSLSPVHWSENKNLIHPQVVLRVIKIIASYVYHRSPFNIDFRGYRDFTDEVVDHYKDFYTEDYLGASSFNETYYAKQMDEIREISKGDFKSKTPIKNPEISDYQSSFDDSSDPTIVYEG